MVLGLYISLRRDRLPNASQQNSLCNDLQGGDLIISKFNNGRYCF